MVEQEMTIADDLRSAITPNPPVIFSETFRDMDKISIHEPTDGKPYPSLRINPPFKNTLESKWSNSIILQLVGKSIAFDLLMDKIKFLWKLENEFKFIDVGDNCFVFNSDCEATRRKILSEGPWIVNGCYLLPRTWIPQFCPSMDKITSTIASVRIIGLPLELYDDTVLFGIAKILGRPIELDYGTNCCAFARLSVEIDLDKPLKTFVMVEEMIYSVEYKNFSVICNECERIGHRNEDCSVKLVNRTSQNEEGVKEVTPTEEMLINVEISPSRGPWMQVGFIKRKRSTNTSSVSEEEGDDSGNDNNHSSEKNENTNNVNDEDHASEVAVNVEVSTSFVLPKGSNGISRESNLTSPNDHHPTKGQEEEDKRRNRSQAHLYTIVKVALDQDLKDQIGKDVYFDLVNLDKVSSFRVLKQMPFYQVKEEVSEKLGIPVQYMRFWKWAKRENFTYRPHQPLTEPEQVQSVAQLMGASMNTMNKTLDLFLEVEYGDTPYPKNTEEDKLVFFKLYDPYNEKLRYVGRLFVQGIATPAEIIPQLKELAGFSSTDDIELSEEIRFEPIVLCESLDKSTSFTSIQIEDGDIICFQKRLSPDDEKQVRYPDVSSYLKSVKARLLSKCMDE